MGNAHVERTLSPSAFHTIVFGGLTVGVLDAIAAMMNAGIRGVTPDRVWQYVASGVLGPESFSGGAATIALGLFFHFCVAFGVAIGYYVVTRVLPSLVPHAFVVGPIYGIIVFFAMSYVIVPMTLVRQSAFTWYGMISGIVIHILFVGLPVALITKRFSRPA